MTVQLIVLERLTRVAPFGVRFWDAVADRLISDDLAVTAFLLSNPTRQFALQQNRSGVYVLHTASGFAGFSFGDGGEAFWESLPPPRSFVIEVSDRQRRFLSMSFTVDAPHRGIFGWADPTASPRGSVRPAVPLYSAATRAVPAGMAVVRADLWDTVNERPAAWAMLEAQRDGEEPSRGVADEHGRVAVMFPYPEPLPGTLSSPLGSPLSGGPRLLADQTWLLHLRGFYSPRASIPHMPALEEVLSQAPATLLASVSPPLPLSEVKLTFGKELIVKSQFRSELLMIPAGSPL